MLLVTVHLDVTPLKKIKRPPEGSKQRYKLERDSFESTLYSYLSYKLERKIFPDETHILCCSRPTFLRPVRQTRSESGM